MAPVIVAYWNIRGLCQPIRLLLAYTGAEWEDKHYQVELRPPYSKKDWFKEKFTLGLDFPNLPYYIDGTFKITQSKAIIRHIARKNNLIGETEEENARMEMIDEEVQEFRASFEDLCYLDNNFESEKIVFLETLPKKLESFSKFLGSRKWLTGDKLTYVDFCFYEILDQVLEFAPNALKDMKNLEDYHQRFENLGPISAYRASPSFIKFPINNPQANFGGAGISG